MKNNFYLRARRNILTQLPEGNAWSGLILVSCTAFSLSVANSAWGDAYQHFWQLEYLGIRFLELINDGLMAIFFFLVGLDIKKELLVGELVGRKKVFLPFICAVGGMVLPALCFLFFNISTPDVGGWAIPTATDIAFSIGILAMLGSRVPVGLKIFLTALAIIDDLGAVVVIALFYSEGIGWYALFATLSLTLFLFFLVKYAKYYNIFYFVTIGFFILFFLYHSGVHTTIAGVLLAMVIPIKFGQKLPNEILSRQLTPIVNYGIVPLFALANTAVALKTGFSDLFFSNIGLGVSLGLVLGKPIGIIVAAFIAVKLKLAELPQKVNWRILLGSAMLAGIGFTMSLFISSLAFNDLARQNIAKVAVLFGSVVSALFGLIFLHFVLKEK